MGQQGQGYGIWKSWFRVGIDLWNVQGHEIQDLVGWLEVLEVSHLNILFGLGQFNWFPQNIVSMVCSYACTYTMNPPIKPWLILRHFNRWDIFIAIITVYIRNINYFYIVYDLIFMFEKTFCHRCLGYICRISFSNYFMTYELSCRIMFTTCKYSLSSFYKEYKSKWL